MRALTEQTPYTEIAQAAVLVENPFPSRYGIQFAWNPCCPRHGRRRRHRKGDQQVEDQKLVRIDRIYHFQTAEDLLQLMPGDLPATFDTSHLANSLGIDRSDAQRIAYCLRHIGAFHEVGKRGNARLYRACA